MSIDVTNSPISRTVARDPGRGDRVADPERAKRQKEEARGEVRQQTGPRRADGDAGGRQQRRE